MSSKIVEKTLEERGKEYGSFERVANITLSFQKVAQRSPSWKNLDASAKLGFFMILHKVARCLNGRVTEDSLLDIQGYAELILQTSDSVKRKKNDTCKDE